MFYSLICLPFLLASFAEANFNAKVWQSAGAYPAQSDYPESSILKSRPNTAIAFTGGGSRAYVAAYGAIAALHKLNLINNIRYIGGISGGAWATMSYTYSQIADDNVFLGDIDQPSDITRDKLQQMNPQCARAFAAANLTLIAINSYLDGTVSTASDAWVYGVSETYMIPSGIPRGKFPSWDSNTVNDIISRNPQLTAGNFIIPAHSDRPYAVVGSAVIGPADGAPYKAKTQNYTMLEFTPLYAGQMRTLEVDYTYAHDVIKRAHTYTVGGAVESYAFSVKGTAPRIGMAQRHTTATLSVPEPTTTLDVAYASGFSSYAPGSFIDSLPTKAISDALGMHVDYWSPSDTLPSATDTLFSDGGCYQNIPLINFLQRKVDKIVLFFNSHMPMQPSTVYNPYTDPYDGTQIDNTLTSFFGVFSPNQSSFENRSYEYEKDQVFSQKDYAPVVSALQAAQQQGGGIIATFDLVTVDNAWWGIPAGQKVQVTFVQLGRLTQWEAQLNKEMHTLLVPEEDASDLAVDIDHGPFKNFPHYATLGGEINAERANALADLTGWAVLNNAATFQQILQ